LDIEEIQQRGVVSMETRAGNSISDFETLFSDFQELLNGSGLRRAAPGSQVLPDFKVIICP